MSESVLRLIGQETMTYLGRIYEAKDKTLRDLISSSRFLVLGGAGSIGQSMVKEFSSISQKRTLLISAKII